MSPNRSVPVLLATLVALTACGSDDPGAADTLPDAGGLRPPTPIEAVEAGAPTGEVGARTGDVGWSAAPMTDAMTMLAPIELVLGDVGELPTATTGYVLPAGATVSPDTVAALAAVLGVEGEPVAAAPDTGMAWQVGPTDGTAPSLMVGADAQLLWWYQASWGSPAETPACMPTTTVPNQPDVAPATIEPCPAPEPPVGVPTAEDAEQRARQLVAELGADPDAVQADVFADEWFASVQITDVLDGVRSPLSWSFGFGADGVLQYANGMLARPEPVGPYPLLDLDAAFTRLQDQQVGQGGFARDMLAAEAVPGPVATTVTVPPSAPDTPVASPIDPPMPPISAPPEPTEPVVVTLVDVEPDLWWVVDVDGTVWLLPAYRFIGDDGGWYTVPAVTDEYLIVVEPQPTPPPAPLPTAPMPGTSPAPVPVPGTDLPDVVDVAGLEAFVGLTLEEFIGAAEQLGAMVRVVVEDGVDLVVTDDYRTDRVNVAVEGGIVTQIIGVG